MTEDRFWGRADRSGGPTACWEWRGYRMPVGYGRLSRDGKMVLAHRVAWELTNGPIPIDDRGSFHGICVLHRCDNRACCNPGHLFLGTQQENMQDCAKKDRFGDRRGERNVRVRFTPEDVQTIRHRFDARESRAQIARDYGTSAVQVYAIGRRRIWAHLE